MNFESVKKEMKAEIGLASSSENNSDEIAADPMTGSDYLDEQEMEHSEGPSNLD